MTGRIGTAVCAAVLVLGAAGCSASGGDSDSAGGRTAASGSPAAATANGADRLPAVEAAKKAVEATRHADSVTVGLETTMDGMPTVISLTLDVPAGDCSGNVKMGEGRAEIIKHGTDLFLKPNRSLWEALQGDKGLAAADRAGDRWFATGTDDAQFAFLTGLCDMDTLLDAPPQQAEKGKATETGGRKAFSVRSRDGAESRTLLIAAQGEPYLLEDVVEGGDAPSRMTFEDYDAPTDIQAPSKEQTVGADTLR